ncbi:MAG: ATP-binding protein [Proteobacteria bacterium]|nr:ATP-binding protein [Pseudomonadota bacterium]
MTPTDLPDEIDPPQFKFGVISSLPSRAKSLEQLVKTDSKSEVQRYSHQVFDAKKAPDDLDAVIFELRTAETFEDIETIKALHTSRPLLPILVVSANENPEIKLLVFQAGVIDYQISTVSSEELTCRTNGLCRIGRAARLVEIQNEELISSMQALSLAESERAHSRAAMVQSAKMASLGEMAGNIAHEINNPLTILFGRIMQLKILFKDPNLVLGNAKELIDGLTTAAERINKIVKGLKTVSRNGAEDPFEPVKIETILADTLSFCAEGIRQQEIDLQIKPFAADLMVECRATQLSQVLLNLLGNARDALTGIAGSWISIEVVDSLKTIDIRVMDSGNGISSELGQKIFEPFFTTKPANKGTGLGLSISTKILKDHHGTLTIDPESKNTCFVLKIPKTRHPTDQSPPCPRI